MDKDGARLSHLDSLGLGAIELGSITLRPRAPGKTSCHYLFRERAIINNLGAPSVGAARVCLNIRRRKAGLTSKMGINLIPNLDAPDYNDIFIDTLRMVKLFRRVADFYVINISSPNMQDLRELQNYRSFASGMKILRKGMTSYKINAPLLVKFASDISDNQILDIVRGYDDGLYDGVVLGNSSLLRPHHMRKHDNIKGGLSGAPIKDISINTIRKASGYSGGKMPIIGVGGIMTGEDVYDKITSGSSLVQLHSALRILPIASTERSQNYISNLNEQLSKYLARDGFKSVSEAVGTAVRPLLVEI